MRISLPFPKANYDVRDPSDIANQPSGTATCVAESELTQQGREAV